jgi:N-acetylglucosaminyldiphosphoundecaprenol N-acetyl-beta-D-mannosaminyltransferase
MNRDGHACCESLVAPDESASVSNHDQHVPTGSGTTSESLGFVEQDACAELKVRPSAGPLRDLFLGVPIDCLTLAETIAMADRAMQTRRPLQHVCINVAKFVAMQSDPELDRDVRSSDIISVDGAGVVWAARLLGIKVPERVAGIDIMQGVIRLCALKDYRPYFLGARSDILGQAIANIKRSFPRLEPAGWRDGYFKPQQEGAVIAEIRSSRADCLFIGMPTPLKERFLARHRDELGVPFIMGVGGAFDVLAGNVRRAPRLAQITGLEWLFRMAQEPLRLGPRYLSTNLAFAGIIAKALTSKLLLKDSVRA